MLTNAKLNRLKAHPLAYRVRVKSSAPAAVATGRHAYGATGDPQYDQSYALRIILAVEALYFVS